MAPNFYKNSADFNIFNKKHLHSLHSCAILYQAFLPQVYYLWGLMLTALCHNIKAGGPLPTPFGMNI